MYYCCGITDRGRIRKHNEDALLINKDVLTKAQSECKLNPPFIVAVADGVAGETSGEIASRLALKLLTDIKVSKHTDYQRKVLNIHEHLRRHGISHGILNMQTTLCALAIDAEGTATIINVGDSRLYRFRSGELKQLSTDQSLVQMLYEQGHITREQKRIHSQRNIIFPVMGNIETEPSVDVKTIEGGIQPGDLIIICSDGLSDYLTTGEFEETLALPKKLPKRLALLVEMAENNGSDDNISIAGISVL